MYILCWQRACSFIIIDISLHYVIAKVHWQLKDKNENLQAMCPWIVCIAFRLTFLVDLGQFNLFLMLTSPWRGWLSCANHQQDRYMANAPGFFVSAYTFYRCDVKHKQNVATNMKPIRHEMHVLPFVLEHTSFNT